jgi:hypothetical protein
MERFAKLHRKSINQPLGTHIAKPPLDSAFRLLLIQCDVEGFEAWTGLLRVSPSSAPEPVLANRAVPEVP